jgi:hypothetical protein
MGARLTEVVSNPRALKKFTPATATQLAISDAVVEQVKEPSLKNIKQVIELCVGRNEEWLAKSRAALAQGSGRAEPVRDAIAAARRAAFDAASIDQLSEAEVIYQRVIAESSDPQIKGLLMQEMAAYRNASNPAAAQEVQRAALQFNRYLLKPIAGVNYEKLRSKGNDQAASVVKHLESFGTLNSAVIALNSICEDLIFNPDATEEFERALNRAGPFLGFASERPEKTEGRGPDNLWAMGGQAYGVIEAKSGTTSARAISKSDCDQLGGSMSWFEAKYGTDVQYTPIIIHPESIFDRQAAPRPKMRIMDRDGLERFKRALADYAAAIGSLHNRPNVADIAPLLDHFKFKPGAFVEIYTRPAKQEK